MFTPYNGLKEDYEKFFEYLGKKDCEVFYNRENTRSKNKKKH